MQIREIHRQDVPSTCDLLIQVYKELTGESINLDFETLFDHLFGQKRLIEAIVAINEKNGDVVGFLFYEPKYFVYSQYRYYNISMIGVGKEYRKLNIAQDMLDFLKEKANKMKISGFCCDIHNVNFVSRSFFRKNNFKEQRGVGIFQKKF